MRHGLPPHLPSRYALAAMAVCLVLLPRPVAADTPALCAGQQHVFALEQPVKAVAPTNEAQVAMTMGALSGHTATATRPPCRHPT